MQRWAKHFEAMYEGSMYGAGVAVFAVWGYVISHAWLGDGWVDLNPQLLANTLGGNDGEVKWAIEWLCRPDPKSEWKSHEGRRLVHEAGFRYFVPSWEHYEKVAVRERKREQNRAAQDKFRRKKFAKGCVPTDAEKLYEKQLLNGAPAEDAAL